MFIHSHVIFSIHVFYRGPSAKDMNFIFKLLSLVYTTCFFSSAMHAFLIPSTAMLLFLDASAAQIIIYAIGRRFIQPCQAHSRYWQAFHSAVGLLHAIGRRFIQPSGSHTPLAGV
ncbi:hypothetical protein ILYODFUR_037340 [Ilyodon furcidens]|uniref:Uncharacterized protein n=1 Tax=Ilyodon furcidens TaxID=33524 RepID=A0ABV0TE95_9TELE